MATKKIAGTLSMNVGTRLASVGMNATLQTQTNVKESKTGLSGDGGFTEKPINPFAEIEILTTDPEMEDAIEALSGRAEDVVQIDADTGESWIFSECWSTGERPRDLSEGNFTVRIECLPGDFDKVS